MLLSRLGRGSLASSRRGLLPIARCLQILRGVGNNSRWGLVSCGGKYVVVGVYCGSHVMYIDCVARPVSQLHDHSIWSIVIDLSLAVDECVG